LGSSDMKLFECGQWIRDIDEELDALPELDQLAGKSVMITGATGLIGSAVVDVLVRYNETHSVPITVYAAGRNEGKVVERFGDKPDLWFIPYDASCGANPFSHHSDYIIHGASNASPNRIVREPVETMLSNFLGMKELLDYANRTGTERLLFISSSEVYGNKAGSGAFKEDEYGYIDLLKARNSYSVGKRAAETLCVSYHDEYGVDSVIVRPGHIYGPTALSRDNRVSSAWAYAVARGENIVMKSDGSQIRSYCYCLDSASAILKALVNGETCRAYNISNPESVISIRQMAEILVQTAGVELCREYASEEDKKGFNPMLNSSLDSESLMALGWRGLFTAERGFAHTVEILKRIEAD